MRLYLIMGAVIFLLIGGMFGLNWLQQNKIQSLTDKLATQERIVQEYKTTLDSVEKKQKELAENQELLNNKFNEIDIKSQKKKTIIDSVPSNKTPNAEKNANDFHGQLLNELEDETK